MLLDGMRPGADGAELFARAVALAERLGFAREFLGAAGRKIKFCGHGVGLELSEPPYLAKGRRESLEEGNTLALELKMVLPDIGAVGLENTVAVTTGGGVVLSPADADWLVLDGRGGAASA